MIRTRITSEYTSVHILECIVILRICEYSFDPIFNCYIRQRDFMSLIRCSRVLENKILIDPATTEGSLS